MTNILKGGDYAPDGAGGFLRADGDRAVLADALFRLTCRRGSFPFFPELGSELYLLGREKPSAAESAARQYAAAALEDIGVSVTDAAVSFAEDGTTTVAVSMTIGGETYCVEVNP